MWSNVNWCFVTPRYRAANATERIEHSLDNFSAPEIVAFIDSRALGGQIHDLGMILTSKFLDF